ncbi:MAG: outer membrane lipid asymmetry maintenance protein MlaD [Paracoccaceae bacterium]
MANNVTETLIGAVVVAAAAGFLFYAGQSTGFSTGTGQYTLTAKFRSVEGLNVGSDVRVAGVKVGTLKAITLDQDTYRAVAVMSLDDTIMIPDDADIKVASDGLLGGAFLEITAGGSPFMLENGDEILLTQGSVSLINLLMKFVSSDTSDE